MSVKNVGATPPDAVRNLKAAVSGAEKAESPFANKLDGARRAANVDTIELSARPASRLAALPEIRGRILSEIDRGKSPLFLSELRARISAGQYPTDPADLADALLSAGERP